VGVETAPDACNASDGPGEAYLAAEELDKARACCQDARSKLEEARDVRADVRARFLASAEKGLAGVEARRKRK
jgi:hypothetical protein